MARVVKIYTSNLVIILKPENQDEIKYDLYKKKTQNFVLHVNVRDTRERNEEGMGRDRKKMRPCFSRLARSSIKLLAGLGKNRLLTV